MIDDRNAALTSAPKRKDPIIAVDESGWKSVNGSSHSLVLGAVELRVEAARERGWRISISTVPEDVDGDGVLDSARLFDGYVSGDDNTLTQAKQGCRLKAEQLASVGAP